MKTEFDRRVASLAGKLRLARTEYDLASAALQSHDASRKALIERENRTFANWAQARQELIDLAESGEPR